MTALLALLLLAQADQTVQLKDGRVLYGRNVKRGADSVRVETIFGPLEIPNGKVGKGRVKPREDKRRTKTTKWFRIEHDLSDERVQLYADQMDSFFDWMIRVYGLDASGVRARAPHPLRLYRKRADFKEVQKRVNPSAEKKGKAFAESVIGFYSYGDRTIYMWDYEGSWGGVHLETAKHETTHLMNHLLGEQRRVRMPSWFQEGTAVYFSMFLATGGEIAEPEDHPGSLAQVVGEIEGKTALGNRELRGVGYAKFLGREYTWGWALVRFVRRHKNGKYWPKLLEYLTQPKDDRAFLTATGFRNDRAFNKAWHAHLLAAKPSGRGAPIGTSPQVLERVAALKKPDKQLARNFARIGASLARARIPAPAIVYLRAALRGGVGDAYVPHLLAHAIAFQARLDDDKPWPAEAMEALLLATRRDPLRAIYRRDLGRQLLAHKQPKAARDALGLALLLAGPDDDEIAIAMSLLDAAVAMTPEKRPEFFVGQLSAEIPPARDALRTAYVYFLQARANWGALVETLERRLKKGEATFQERAMLAGLYKASDELEAARDLYAELLDEQPTALRFWPDLIECLLGVDDREAARAAMARAREALRKDPRDNGPVRRRLERLEVD